MPGRLKTVASGEERTPGCGDSRVGLPADSYSYIMITFCPVFGDCLRRWCQESGRVIDLGIRRSSGAAPWDLAVKAVQALTGTRRGPAVFGCQPARRGTSHGSAPITTRGRPQICRSAGHERTSPGGDKRGRAPAPDLLPPQSIVIDKIVLTAVRNLRTMFCGARHAWLRTLSLAVQSYAKYL
jgi:hypothetical protein